MAAENLGELEAGVKLTPDTSEVETAISNMTSKAKAQFDSLSGQTLTQLTNNFKGFANSVTGGLDAINASIGRIQQITSLGILGGGIAGLVHQIFQTRSYFQDAASSMKTFLGDAEKGAKFTKELQDYAFYNMYEFQDLVGASKQLIAYGTTEGKEIINVIDQLSNIATGTGADLNSMIDIYNKVKAQGTANGIVLDQLASRGLLVKDTLKQMGETVDGNKVTFEQFQKVLSHVTAEGGMFHDLMKDQLNNLSASSAQLSDNLTNMFNTIGEALEPVMKEAIDLAGLLIEKGTEGFEAVQGYLFDIAKAYGIYKVVDAGMTWNAENKEQERGKSVEKVTAALEDAAEATKNIENADLQAAVAKKKLTQEEANEIAQIRKQVAEENKSRVAKGELTKEEAKKIAAVKEGLKVREIELKQVQKQSAEELDAINKEIAALEKKIALQQTKVTNMQTYGNEAGRLAAETEALKIKDLEQKKHNLTLAQTAAAERQEAATTGIATLQQAQNTAALAQNTQARSVWARGLTAAGSALKGIGSSIVEMINPMGLLISAVAFLAEHLWEVYEAGSATEQAQKRLREAQDEAERQTLEEMQKLGEYAQIIRQSKEDTDAFKDAKEGLWEMANKLNIQTTETVNGVKQEMSAIDLINKKYDEYKEKIRQVANEQAFQAYVKNEKQAINDQITDVTSYLREEMEDLLLDGLKGDEWGVKKAEISAAISDIGIQLLEGNTMLTGKTKELYDEYVEKLGGASFFSSTYWKNIGKTFKREMHGVEDAISGDGELNKMQDGESFSEYTTRTAKGYGAYLMQRAKTKIDASNATIIAAKKAFNIHDEEETDGDDEEETDGKSPFTKKILKAKEDAKKYIEEYSKIAEERRKALRKIEMDASIDEEQRQAKKNKVETNATQQFEELAAQYEHFTQKIKGTKFSEDIFSNYGIGIDTEDRNLIQNLEAAYEYASNTEVSIAREKKLQTVKEIADINKQIEQLQAKDEIDAKTGKVKQRTQEEESAINATVNQMQQRIAVLTAISEGYQAVINADKEWEKNFTRIHAITKQENDKFLDSQVKKQQEIKENYDKLRRELMLMFDDKQLSEEEYRRMSFQLDVNEEKAKQQEYINIYGGYYAKREELTRTWEQRLANVPPEYFNVAKQQMVDELSKMDFSHFKESLNWDAIFGDVSQQSAKAIKQNLDELKAAFSAEKGKMGIEEIKTVTEAIAKLDDELNKRNPWRAIASSIRTMNSVKDKLPELTEKHKKAQEELNKATVEYIRLKNELEELEERLNNPDLTAEQRAELETQYNDKLKEEGAALAVVTDKENAETNARKALNEETERGTKAQGAFAEGLKNIGGYLSQAGQAFSKLAGAMGESGEKLAMWGDTLSTLGDQASQIAQNWGNKGAMISQAISGTITMVSNVIASRKKAKQDEEAWAKAQRAVIENMKLARIEEERTKTKDNEAFGVRDYLSEVKDAVKAYGDAQNELYSKIQEMQEKGKAKKGQRDGIDWGTVGKNTATGAGVGAAIGSLVGPIGTAIGAAVGALGGFVSGLFSKKKKNIWGGLFDQYPELLEKGADGEERINTELAEQLIQQGILNDETKQMVEDAKAYQEEMDKAREQIEEIAESLLGSLGSNLQNALVDAFVAGEDAAEALHKTVESTLEDMIKNLLYGARLAPILQKIKEQTADVLANGGGAVDVMNVIKENYADLTTASQQFYDDIGYMKEEAAKSGFDIFSGEAAQRNAVSGGIANVTQDTAEEMNGRLTQIQSHTFAISENMKMMIQMQSSQLTILQGIHTDTGQLHAIRASIANLESTVSDIQIRGVKLKQ